MPTPVTRPLSPLVELDYRLVRPMPDLALSLGIYSETHVKCFEALIHSVSGVLDTLALAGTISCRLAASVQVQADIVDSVHVPVHTGVMHKTNALAVRRALGTVLRRLQRDGEPILVERNRERLARDILAMRARARPARRKTVELVRELRGRLP